MKLGSKVGIFSEYGENRYQMMSKFGFLYCDLSIEGELDGRTEKEFYESVQKEADLARQGGVTMWQVHGPWRCPPHDETPELRAERMETMKRSIRAAAMIGSRYWVIHPIMPFGCNDDFHAQQLYEINYSFFEKLLPTAKREGVIICLENMPFKKLPISTPEKTVEFVRSVHDEHFKLCLDTGHALTFGIQPADALRQVWDEVRVLHIHDNVEGRDNHTIPGTGIGDWIAFRDALVEIGFDGVYSLECGWTNFLPNVSNETRLKSLCAVLDEFVPTAGKDSK